MSSYLSREYDLSGSTNYPNVYELLDKLCKQIIGASGGNHREVLRNVAQFFSNSHLSLGSTLPFDEGTITAIITQHLSDSQSRRPSTAASKPEDFVWMFSKMHDELKSTQLDSRKRSALLTFLFLMADKKNANGFQNLTARYNCSTSLTSQVLRESRRENKPIDLLLYKRNSPSTNSIGSAGSIANKKSDSELRRSNSNISHGLDSLTDTMAGRHLRKATTSLSEPFTSSESEESLYRQDDIVQNVIYSFTGIEGKYLKKDVITGRFKLDNKERSLDMVQASMILRLSQLGYYHDLVKSFTDPKSGLCAIGLMGQGFISALKNELTKYYGMVAILQEQLNQQNMSPMFNNCRSSNQVVVLPSWMPRSGERMTLMRVLIWYVEPLHRLQWLARIGEACSGQKGGALASTVHSFLSKGDPSLQQLTRDILLAVCRPMYRMLTAWMLEGDICDTHGEFFIECINDVGNERLWHDKYRVHPPMLPTFISGEIAKKILVAGKSIKFLGQLCETKQTVKGCDELCQCIEENGEDIFSTVSDTKLHSAIDIVYLSTSKCVLDIVVGPHRLLDHLQGMRRYLLLGQGDFVNLLMENLKTELDKPAKNVLTYDLHSIMDISIRATNACYEDSNILNHLDIRMISPCDGEIGWDIISLQYKLDGPLAALLEPAMDIYQLLFKPLWRMKHMKFVLTTKIWKDQTRNAKPLRCMDEELRPILYSLHFFTSEIIHFTHQMQYYMLFEVIECSWVELQEQLQQAKSLDDLLEAHYNFLNTVKAGAFLNTATGTLLTNMEAVYDGIKSLERWQDTFYEICFKELNARKAFEAETVASEKAGKFGMTAESQLQRDFERKQYEMDVAANKLKLDMIRTSHEQAVHNFLMALNSNDDPNLQLFGIRLDFNEYYKKRDQRLCVPLTFQHMRYSNTFFGSNKSPMASRHSQYN